jgi:DNA-directed RNA polymerase subunit beta
LRSSLNKDAVDKETGEVIVKDYIKEQKIFMGDFPVMTPVGTFIINGSERVMSPKSSDLPACFSRRKWTKNPPAPVFGSSDPHARCLA